MTDMNADTTNNGHNTTAGDVPDLSREGDNDKLSHRGVPGLTREMLPVLTEMFEKKARSDSSIEWAKGSSSIEPGMLHMDSEGLRAPSAPPQHDKGGTGLRDIRVFLVAQHDGGVTHSAGIEVEIDGFAQITTPPLENGPAEEVGVPRDDASDASSESMLDLTDGTGMGDMRLGTTASGGAESPRSGDVVLMSQCNCEFCFHGIDHRETKWCFPIGSHSDVGFHHGRLPSHSPTQGHAGLLPSQVQVRRTLCRQCGRRRR